VVKKLKQSKYFKILILFIITLFSAFPTIFMNFGTENYNLENGLNSSNNPIEDSVLWNLLLGLPGKNPSMEPFSTELDNSGKKYIIVGTDAGMGILETNGDLLSSFVTFGPVIDIEIIDDISGDGLDDLIIIVLDQEHPNVYCVSSNNGTELWRFNTYITGFNPDLLLPQNYTSYSWAATMINDTNNDNIPEVVISSWYRLYCISGSNGTQIWKNNEDIIDDIWKLETISDINMDSYVDLIVGTEDGEVMALNSIDGTKIWDFVIPKIQYTTYGTFGGYETKEAQVSIADIKIISDFDNDQIADILVAADNSILYLLSGNPNPLDDSMRIIAQQKIYSNGIPNDDYPVGSSRFNFYNYKQRVFGKSGVKISEIIDVNNDGFNEFSVFSGSLNIRDSYSDDMISILNMTGTVEPGALNNITELSINYFKSRDSSYPAFVNINGEIRAYFIDETETQWGSNEFKTDISYYNYEISDTEISSLTSVTTITEYNLEDVDNYYSPYDTSGIPFTKYLVNMGDIYGNGGEYLFGFSISGSYFMLDVITSQIVWIKYKESATGNIEEFSDINSDSILDLIYTQEEEFSPVWRRDEYYPHSYGKITSKILAIDAISGNIIWEYENPSPDYKGILSFQAINDIDGDLIDDFVGIIIPTYIPDNVENYIIKMSQSKFEDMSDQNQEKIYRALLANYTKIISISGKTGLKIREIPAFDAIYDFKRVASYSGTYENPSSGSVSTGRFFNRINRKTPEDWYSGFIYSWSSEWAPETLTHPNKIVIESGSDSEGSFLDLWNIDSDYYSFNCTNSSALINTGIPKQINSEYTIESDGRYWIIDSVNNDNEEIDIELYLNNSIAISNPIDSIDINFNGKLSAQTDEINLSVYNFNSHEWTSILSNNINSSTIVRKIGIVPDVTDYTSNNAIKIRIKAYDSTNFSLSIDQLNAEYNYKTRNVTITSENVNNLQQALINFTFKADLSNDDVLGSMEYPLSQIERLSAFKLQTKLLVNTSSSIFYNFTYQMYNFTSESWVETNWTNGQTYWNQGTNSFKDLYGGYSTSARSSFNYFDLDSTLKTDVMFVGTRGIHSAISDWDEYVELDYENSTTLSHLIDKDTNEFKVRINVSRGNYINPFNLTIDTFGVEPFYWGLYGPDMDNYYVFDYDDTSTPWDTTYLLDNEILDFDVGLLNNDIYYDGIIVIGSYYYNSKTEEIRMFDFKNDLGITKWGGSSTEYPINNGQILYFNKNSSNGMIFYSSFSGNKVMKRISDFHWDEKLSRFEDFDSGKTNIDYYWSYTPDFNTFEETSLIQLNDTNYGLSVFYTYEDPITFSEKLDCITILNPDSTTNIYNISKIDGENMFDYYAGDPKYTTNFIDINNDGVIDHAALYHDPSYNSWQNDYMNAKLKIFSGNSSEIAPIKSIDLKISVNDFYLQKSSPNFDYFPITTIKDIDGDSIEEFMYCVQGIYHTSGASVQIINSSNNIESTKIIEPFVSRGNYYEGRRYFFPSMINIGDINNDNVSELYTTRTVEKKSGDWNYDEVEYMEIIDPLSGVIMSRVNIDVSNSIKISNLNGDNINEFLFFSGDIVFCINSKFCLSLPDNTSQIIANRNSFKLDWDTAGDYSYFEIVVNGVTYAITEDTEMDMSLSGGDKIIQILMYDKSGVISVVETISIAVNTSYIMLIVTIAALVGLTVYIVIRKRSNKKLSREIVINNGGRL
jgi:hypothetical protein